MTASFLPPLRRNDEIRFHDPPDLLLVHEVCPVVEPAGGIGEDDVDVVCLRIWTASKRTADGSAPPGAGSPDSEPIAGPELFNRSCTEGILCADDHRETVLLKVVANLATVVVFRPMTPVKRIFTGAHSPDAEEIKTFASTPRALTGGWR